MRKKLPVFLKNLSSKLALLIVLTPLGILAANGVMPIDDNTLKLPDGRVLDLKRTGDHSRLVTMKRGKVTLWKKEYEQEYDRLWDYAFFVPMKRGQYLVDINHDGFPEVAIATWDGGNSMAHRSALIFTVKPNKLVYYARRPFNLEYGESAY